VLTSRQRKNLSHQPVIVGTAAYLNLPHNRSVEPMVSAAQLRLATCNVGIAAHCVNQKINSEKIFLPDKHTPQTKYLIHNQ
jgi:hypothetical protein